LVKNNAKFRFRVAVLPAGKAGFADGRSEFPHFYDGNEG
jgi:hypothetical protein